MAHPLVKQVREAGVVGAGGAGFPTYVKLGSTVDTYIVNAAECEPLLCKDQELLRHHPERLVDGLRRAMESTGAGRGVIAIKKHYERAIAALNKHISGPIELYLYDNFYPAGDEFVTVYDVTGRLIPPGGLPLQVGCAVNNVETLINVSLAADGVPVTHTALTVTGAVAQPVSVVVPLGVTVREVLALAGGATIDGTIDDLAVVDGGPMMGKAVLDLDKRVTKTSGGYVVLPRDHKLIVRKTQSEDVSIKISRSACDQCSYCTELCPRYLLGYAIEPHKVMRSVGFAGDTEARWAQLGLLCCECALCELYSCPEDLPPMSMCVRGKKLWSKDGKRPEPLPGRGKVHPARNGRRIPIPRLTQRLGLTRYDVPAPMTDETLTPQRVQLLLRQHIGAPATPVVKKGEAVTVGQVVATVPEDKLGVPIHASIDGTVSRIDGDSVWLEARR